MVPVFWIRSICNETNSLLQKNSSSLFFYMYFSVSVSFSCTCLFLFAINIFENWSASCNGNQPYTSMHISGNSMNKLKCELKLADEKKKTLSAVHGFILTVLSSVALIRQKRLQLFIFFKDTGGKETNHPCSINIHDYVRGEFRLQMCLLSFLGNQASTFTVHC